ncbi:MAG: electron transporter [Streptosporangiales bacterium]|nr:electron transporter [Streptosporangiales bacterium]
MPTMGTKKVVISVAAAVVVVGGAAGLYLFQPWQLFVNETVQEGVPGAAASPSPSGSSPDSETPAAGPVELAGGKLITHEHDTTGSVRILRLADGSRVLRLENLATSSGPDLHVWVTDAEVKPGRAGWHVFDDGRHVTLGSLKGNRGDQNYRLPADLDLGDYRSVTIWCDRFNVSFGAATLSRA